MQKFTKTNPCRWGIIGPGKIAQKFAQAIPFAGNAVLQAVASREGQRSREFAEKHHAAKWYDDYEYLVTDPDIDAIHIATPHAFHAESALHCLSQVNPCSAKSRWHSTVGRCSKWWMHRSKIILF